MNILGLHFGRDAGAAIVRDGRVVCQILRERRARIEHAMTLDLATIERALEAAGLKPADLDFCAITSTQYVELIVDRPDRLAIRLTRHPRDDSPSTVERVIAERGADLERMLKATLLQTVYDGAGGASIQHQTYPRYFPEHRARPREAFHAVGWLDDYVSVSGWERKATLEQLSITNAAAAVASEALRRGFHLPVTVELDGVSIPGAFVHHHLCHAASSYFRSGLSRALVLTHDAHALGSTYQSGMFYFGDGHRLTPLAPHHLAIGALHEAVGHALGFGDGEGDPGLRLTGLAGHGSPRLFERRFVGNWYDAEARFDGHYATAWLLHCRKRARKAGYDLSAAGEKARATERINADIAASTQKLFEETMLAAVEALAGLAQTSGVRADALCLAGSAALNAPCNSRIAREGPFSQVFVGAGCDDSGLAIGAALAAYHSVLDQARPLADAGAPAPAYLGMPVDDAGIAKALEDVAAPLAIQAISDAPERAARDLAAGKLIGWFEGRSEIGPYALGHRSILGDPREAATAERISLITGREAWLPLGAAVLESESADWFAGAPAVSPDGLFAGTVRSSAIPALTRSDGPVRFQTVGPSSGELFHLLRAFYVLTRVPLAVNAPFGKAGEPMVETPDEALRFFIASNLDALYIADYRIARSATAKATGKPGTKKAGPAAKRAKAEAAHPAKRETVRPRRRASV